MPLFDLKDQMAFYGSYHNNFLNQVVHVIFVPMIMWTALVWLSYSGPLFAVKFSDLGAWTVLLPAAFHAHFSLNLGFFVLSFYALYYLSLDFAVAAAYDVLLFLMFLSANAFHTAFPREAWVYATILHIVSWFFQVSVGHYIFEKRKPSLTTSFFQSVVLAPLFVFYEILFWLGFRAELKKELQVEVNKRIAILNAADKKGK